LIVPEATLTRDRHDALISVDMPAAFHEGWNKIEGVTVTGTRLTINPDDYFFAREPGVTWVLCDWAGVRANLLGARETSETAIEQQVLDYVREYGRETTDAAEVLLTAWGVNAYLFRDELRSDPGLAWVPEQMPRMLRECSTLTALNRVRIDGTIPQVGPAWMIAAAAAVVYGLDETTAETLDELYHGTWFNEGRRIESVLAHAALGGRLVHGCQSSPNMSGGCVVPYGTDIAAFRTELGTFRAEWLHRVHAMGA
jgi:hypothetical protein